MKKILLAAALLACVQGTATAQKFERTGDIVTYRGNKFEYSKAGALDTQMVTDPISGKQLRKVSPKDPILTKMNGVKIYAASEVTEKPTPKESSVELAIVKGLSSELNKLPNGNYLLYVANIVVDQKGKIVYYEYDGISSERSKIKIPADIKKALDSKVDDVVNKVPALTPGKINGRPVAVRTDISVSMYTIAVKKHKATMVRGF